jgi:signal transduction histidine kinase
VSRSWTLVARLRTAVLALALVLAVVVGAAGVLLSQVRHSQDRVVGEFFSAFTISNELFVQVLEIDDAGRDYVRTGEPAELDRLRLAQAPAAPGRTAEDVVVLLEGAPQAQAALATARSTAREWLAELQGLVAQVQAEGPSAETAALLPAVREQFGVVRLAYGDYLSELRTARNDERDALRTRTSLLFGAVLLTAVAAVAAAAALALLLSRWVTRPLLGLATETRQVRQGELGHRVVATGPPEIVGLGADVEQMRERLVAQLEEADSARLEVEHSRRLLEAQAEDLRRSNRDLEQFAYVASHDLQEPLRKVASFCQMLERRYSGQLDDRADQYIAFAVDGAKRMQQLINDLLAFSRVGRMTQGFSDVDLDDVLADALRNLQSAVEESSATVTADPLPVVPGERGLLVQLLQNLVGNALKFRGPDPPRVHIGARRDGDVWELRCTDNGIGVEPQYADRVFVIFQRLHPKTDYEGTGIGLALCKKIVEHHGGDIALEPHDGPGTTVRWTLPAQPPVRALEPAEQPATLAAGPP